jgi:hypothetical protein
MMRTAVGKRRDIFFRRADFALRPDDSPRHSGNDWSMVKKVGRRLGVRVQQVFEGLVDALALFLSFVVVVLHCGGVCRTRPGAGADHLSTLLAMVWLMLSNKRTAAGTVLRPVLGFNRRPCTHVSRRTRLLPTRRTHMRNGAAACRSRRHNQRRPCCSVKRKCPDWRIFVTEGKMECDPAVVFLSGKASAKAPPGPGRTPILVVHRGKQVDTPC